MSDFQMRIENKKRATRIKEDGIEFIMCTVLGIVIGLLLQQQGFI